ncbi:DUF6855 family protein [Arthrobacter sp. MDT3-24]
MSQGTNEDPWKLATAPGTSEYTMYREEDSQPPALVCQVGSTTLRYHLSVIEDLHQWLMEQGDWVPLGAADENKPAAEGNVEAWGAGPGVRELGSRRSSSPRPCALQIPSRISPRRLSGSTCGRRILGLSSSRRCRLSCRI